MKSRICLREGRPAERLLGIMIAPPLDGEGLGRCEGDARDLQPPLVRDASLFALYADDHPAPTPPHQGEGLNHRSWLSLLPRRLMVEWTTRLSRSDWHATQVRTPGSASRRFLGIGSPQSSHSSALSPLGVSARARRIASFTVSSIWS